MPEAIAFKRKSLAIAYCDSLEGKGIAHARSGLFLAGPRRVGKSTFLMEDLIPEAHKRRWVTVYIDLWANKLSDPAALIIETVKTSILSLKSKLAKLATHVNVQKINMLGTLSIDFKAPGLPDHVTLVDLLQHLAELAKKPILLIIDEAQHALSSQAGMNTMFAIKSARDQINTAAKAPGLMLVFTGSNRDKLAQLVIKKDQPFFGSEVTAFPLLQRDYTDFFTDKVNQSLATHNQFTPESTWEAFQLVGHRPEILRQIVGRAAISNAAQSFSDLLKKDASLWQDQLFKEFNNEFNALPALHRAIIQLLIEQGRAWSPFSEDSMNAYKKILHQETLAVSSVQTAVQSLREQGFIWQSSRGLYALEDDSFAAWFNHTQVDKK